MPGGPSNGSEHFSKEETGREYGGAHSNKVMKLKSYLSRKGA